MIPVATSPAEHRADVAVDGLDGAERDLFPAVGEDAVEMPAQELGDRVERRQPLPAEGAQPRVQEAPRRPFVGVVPEVGQLLLEQVGVCPGRQACSVGGSPTGARARRPVAWMAGQRKTKALKPIDKPIGKDGERVAGP